MMSRPYVVETHPDDGRAAVVVVGGDLSGCFDGINDAGLAVALFADDESASLQPTHQLQAGVHETQLPRLLLDRCSTVDEAVEVLYGAKQYDNFITCHYLVADAHGDAIVWERESHNTEHVVRATDAPMCVTNHLLHRHASVDALPEDGPDSNTYERARTLQRRLERTPLTPADIRAAMRAVRVEGPIPTARTLWSALYDLTETIHSTPDPDHPGAGMMAAIEMLQYAHGVWEDRRATPRLQVNGRELPLRAQPIAHCVGTRQRQAGRQRKKQTHSVPPGERKRLAGGDHDLLECPWCCSAGR